VRTALVERPLDCGRLLSEVADPRYGAAALFVGTVRSLNEGREVTSIEYTAYPEMAVREMGTILDEAERRYEGCVIVAEHRIGLLSVGEASIAIVAAHEHRFRALDALRYAIDEIKTRVPIWKREHYADGSVSWVDPAHVAGESPE
jgi:molybdopterin synthase catalytic subunit